ncbi:hypothetical protein D9M70_507380 [compost metagenome]
MVGQLQPQRLLVERHRARHVGAEQQHVGQPARPHLGHRVAGAGAAQPMLGHRRLDAGIRHMLGADLDLHEVAVRVAQPEADAVALLEARSGGFGLLT